MGSKNRIAKYICPILQKEIDDTGATLYIEPFCGGCNIIDKIKCKNKIAYDNNETLIALLTAARDNFSIIPLDWDRERWDKGKKYKKFGIKPDDMSLVDIGAIEFFASFSNGGFPKGYAADHRRRPQDKTHYEESYYNLQRQIPNLQDIIFECKDYRDIDFSCCRNAVIYCDPPYQGTVQYVLNKEDRINYTEFWNWIRYLSKDNSVFISEQQAPDDFEEIWSGQLKRYVCATSNSILGVEKLFRLKDK